VAHFAAPAGLLVAAEWKSGVRKVVAIDPDVPAFSFDATACAFFTSRVQTPAARP